MTSFDRRMYLQMQDAMHQQSLMSAGGRFGPSGIPHHQAYLHAAGGPSSAIPSLGGSGGGSAGGGGTGGLRNLQGAPNADHSKLPRASSAASSTARGAAGSPFNRAAGPNWPNTYRAAQNMAFPEARLACGECVAEFVEDLAQGIGCPVEQVLVPLLPCVGSLMGTSTSIRVHRAWSEPPVVWSMVGAAAGSRRSAIIRQLLAPILALQAEKGIVGHSTDGDANDLQNDTAESEIQSINGRGTPRKSLRRALYSGTRISLGALTEVLHRNSGHAFSLTENVEHLHEMLGLTQLPAVAAAAAATPVSCPVSRLVSVMEDLYEGLPLVAVEDGKVTTIQGSNFCHGGFSSPEYMVTLMLKYPGWLSSRLLISCPQADNMKSVFGLVSDNNGLPELSEVYAVLLEQHNHKNIRYTFTSDAVQELNTFFDEEWSTVFNQLDQNEHEGIIVKSMGQIVRLCGILKALENSILTASCSSDGDTFEWDWTIGPETVKSGVTLGKYFLEQKLAMTFMVSTGFFNHTATASQDSIKSEDNDNNGHDNNDEGATILPHTATPEALDEITFPGGQGHVGGGGMAGLPNSSSSFSMTPPTLPRSGSRSQELNLGQSPFSSSPVMPLTDNPFGLLKKSGEVDFNTLPATMTTAEEDVSEMMQAVDFVHFSKTQFVAVHGRRIKRLMECYDDGHGVSATTAAQKSITPPVHIEGHNNRHPAWASALFFQKVAELGLGVAEQSRHPTNKKVCWRFKRKPVTQLQDQDFKLLQYLRVEMDKYSQFGSGSFNPSDMVNSGVLTVPPSTSPGPSPLQLAALAAGSNPLTDSMDDSSSESSSKERTSSVNIKSEVYPS